MELLLFIWVDWKQEQKQLMELLLFIWVDWKQEQKQLMELLLFIWVAATGYRLEELQEQC